MRAIHELLSIASSLIHDRALPNKWREKTDIKSLLKACSRFKYLGDGRGRVVYALNSRKVVKIAKNTLGINQNLNEVELSLRYNNSSILAKVLESSPDGLWVVAERVDTLGKTEYAQVSNVPALIRLIDGCLKGSSTQQANDLRQFVSGDSRRLESGDLRNLSSWGQRTDGTFAIIDYGTTLPGRKNKIDTDEDHNSIQALRVCLLDLGFDISRRSTSSLRADLSDDEGQNEVSVPLYSYGTKAVLLVTGAYRAKATYVLQGAHGVIQQFSSSKLKSSLKSWIASTRNKN
jgi:hypothetical protein